MNISRRNLLKIGGGTAAMLMAGARPRTTMANSKAKKLPIGLQLWSVRHQCEKNVSGVLAALAEMGYQGVEFAGYYGQSAKQLRKILDDNGLKCCGSHLKLDVLTGDNLKETVEFNHILGNKYLIVAWMEPAYAKSVQTVKEKAKIFNEVASKIQPHGMRVGYHAHGHDFKKLDGQSAWNILFENTNKDVIMQMDLGNCLEAGDDPIAILKKFPGRAATIHLKEFGGPDTAVLGEGDVDWKQVFRICETTGGTEWYIVEHERGAGDPLDNVKRCLQNLKKMGKA